MGKWFYLNSAIVIAALIYIRAGYKDYAVAEAMTGIVQEQSIGPWQVKLMSEQPLVAGEEATFYVEFHCERCFPNFQTASLTAKALSSKASRVLLKSNLSRCSGVLTLPEAEQDSIILELQVVGWNGDTYVAHFPVSLQNQKTK